jgi:hypothetical protein
MRDVEELANLAFNAALQLHKELGPGLLESVYEAILQIFFWDRGSLSSGRKQFR